MLTDLLAPHLGNLSVLVVLPLLDCVMIKCILCQGWWMLLGTQLQSRRGRDDCFPNLEKR